MLMVFGMGAAYDEKPWSVGPVIGPIMVAEGLAVLGAMGWFIVRKSMAAFVVGVLGLLPLIYVVFAFAAR